jgi:hypothetical protein
MPAVSKAQYNYMQGCQHNPAHMKGECPSADVASEYTQESPAGLPQRKPKKDKPTKSLKSRML